MQYIVRKKICKVNQNTFQYEDQWLQFWDFDMRVCLNLVMIKDNSLQKLKGTIKSHSNVKVSNFIKVGIKIGSQAGRNAGSVSYYSMLSQSSPECLYSNWCTSTHPWNVCFILPRIQRVLKLLIEYCTKSYFL